MGELLAAAPDIVAHQKTWAVDPVGVLDKLVAKQKGEAKTIMAPRVAALKKRLNDLKKAVETGDFKNANAISEEVFFAAAGATRAVNDFAADFPAYKVERDKVGGRHQGAEVAQAGQADRRRDRRPRRQAGAVPTPLPAAPTPKAGRRRPAP